VIRLSLRFPAGRFHATPWDHHVNEGVVEWPPSPWRILRALTSVLHTRPHRADPATARAAIAKLFAAPSFTLPRASTGHTRHYLSQNQLDRNKTAMVFDSFVAVERDAEVIVHWPCEITAEQRGALASLIAEVSYLGRAETWADLRLVDPAETVGEPNCFPSDGRAAVGKTTVRVLCPDEGFTVEDLERSSTTLASEGWSEPPGTRHVFYRRETQALLPERITTVAPVAALEKPKVTIAEFALEVRGGTVLPLLIDAVRVGDQFRRAVMSFYKKHEQRPPAVFSGRSEDVPREDQHLHAHYVPEARQHRARGQQEAHRITHLVVWAPEGFSDEAQAALRNVTFLALPWRRDRSEEYNHEHCDGDLRVVLNGFGTTTDLAKVSPLFGTSDRWRSRTPFVLPRHIKSTRESPEEQLLRELTHRKIDAPVTLEKVSDAILGDGGQRLLWRDFRRWRKDDKTARHFEGFELKFSAPVSGPLLLGYGSHYGLGQFEALP
jgi:CRISPR-associated protein Csb2